MRRLGIIFSLGYAATALAAPNLIKNPSFEMDANGDGVPDGWTHEAGHYGRWQEKLKKQLGRGTLVEEQAASGKRSHIPKTRRTIAFHTVRY